MSFSIEFVAHSRAAAESVVNSAPNVPDAVKALILAGLSAVEPDQGAVVKAVGHIYDAESGNSYRVTTCQLEVRAIQLVGTASGETRPG